MYDSFKFAIDPKSVQESIIEPEVTVTSESESEAADSVVQVKAEEKTTPEKVTYTEKTARIQALSQLIKSIAPLIWAVVILIVIVPLLGRFLITQSVIPTPAQITPAPDTTLVIESRPDLTQINQDIAAAVQKARTSAETFAAQELDTWEEELITRVDNSFLDWYFDYFNQKKIEFTAPFVWIPSALIHLVKPDSPPASKAVAERITADFQREFAKRVLVPKNAQIKLEVLTNETINLYVSELGNNITKIQSKYKIPQGQWDRYLNDISTTIKDTEGNISNLSLKVLVGGGGYLVAKPLIVAVAGKVGSKVTAKLAGKAAAKMAAKTGGTVAGQLGVSLIDPIVGVGILIWDVWDYHHTAAVERPILRQNLLDYLKNVKRSLLKDPQTGIMAAIYQLEGGILKSIQPTTRPLQ